MKNLSTNKEKLKIGGIYKHYKGALYQVLYLAKHSESLEPLVIYQDIENLDLIWARPLEMFLEHGVFNHVKQNRFQFIY